MRVRGRERERKQKFIGTFEKKKCSQFKTDVAILFVYFHPYLFFVAFFQRYLVIKIILFPCLDGKPKLIVCHT